MTRDGRDDMTELVRSAIRDGMRRPTAEFRRPRLGRLRRALDRHLAARRALRQVGKRP